MSEKLEREADKMMVDISSDLREKERRLERLKKIKNDVTEILSLGEVPDDVLFEKVSSDNKLLEGLEQGDEGVMKLDELIDEYRDGTYFQFNRKSLDIL